MPGLLIRFPPLICGEGYGRDRGKEKGGRWRGEREGASGEEERGEIVLMLIQYLISMEG